MENSLKRYEATSTTGQVYDHITKRHLTSVETAAALNALFEQIDRYIRHPVLFYPKLDSRYARIWFNNEYPITLPIEAILALWPNAKESQKDA